jgi:hypothetical protein
MRDFGGFFEDHDRRNAHTLDGNMRALGGAPQLNM